MIREGIVKGKNGDMLQVCFERPQACEKCGACSGHTNMHMTAIKGNAEIGDRVAVDMPDAKIVRISVLVYAVPLAFLLMGLLIGQLLLKSDVWAAVIGLVLMAVSYLVLHRVDQKLKDRPGYVPELVAVVPAQRNVSHEEESRN